MIMKLTAAAKIDFDKWYLEQDYCIASLTEYSKEQILKMFYALFDSFKYSVLVDFFDSKNIFLSTNFETFCDNHKGIEVTIKNYFCWVNDELITNCKTRNEARLKGVCKANDLYNELYQTSKNG